MQTPRFEGPPFSITEVVALTPDLETLGQGFRCNRPEFASRWNKGQILRETRASTSRCWLLHRTGKLAGYITLLADKLPFEKPPLKTEGVNFDQLPAVKIGWLAADKRAKGAGSRLVEWALHYAATELAPRLGIRFMTVDAFYDPDTGYDVSPFYAKFGFAYANPDEALPPSGNFRTMYFDLKPLIDALAE